MKIVFLGNFDVNFSTESHHKWTWEKLGHEVVALQENRTPEKQLLAACTEDVKLLQWTHTHSFESPITQQTIDEIHNRGIKSMAYHLDKYFGIPVREGRYLEHPSFHLGRFFSTDGGNDDKWREAGINHHWLLGGCVEYGCYMAEPDPNQYVDVLFSGSEKYHGEYPFRPEMIWALRQNYGDRFRVINGVREEKLNTVYASAKIVVGDHIFAGCPLYSSDRLFEVTGRGGFLIYPNTPGVTDQIPGLAVYEPQNVQDLIHQIDYYLDKGHEAERIERRNSAHNWVKNNATYTHRLREILKVMGL